MLNQKAIEDFIYSYHKEYFSVERERVKDDIGRFPYLTRKLLNALEIHDRQMKNFVVTGSKGKGSVCRILSTLLSSLGYKVGLFTSPHHYDYRERIMISGQMIPEERFVSIGETVMDTMKSIPVSSDEYISPMGLGLSIAMKYFQEEGTDFNILECGRGGRFDDVNQVTHQYALINQIFVEHREYLGDTIEEVLYHKAGIITEETELVFVNDRKPSIVDGIKDEAGRKNTVFIDMTSNDDLSYRSSEEGLFVEYQNETLYFDVYSGYTIENFSFVMKILKTILEVDNIEVTQEQIDSMDFQGGLNRYYVSPMIFIDGCIHTVSLKKILSVIPRGRKNYCISGVSTDKEYDKVFDMLLEHFDFVYGAKPSKTHHDFVDEYEGVMVHENIQGAMKSCLMEMDPEDMLLIIGIQGIVAEAKQFLGENYDLLDHICKRECKRW